MRTNRTSELAACLLATVAIAAFVNTAPATEPTRLIASPMPARMPDDSDLVIETINERYTSGKTKVEKQVAMDIDLNFVNHGEYRMFDQQGNEIAHGVFEAGLRTGEWTRTFKANESTLFAQSPYKTFQAPYTSTATFENGLMQGTWIIRDAQDRKISEINLINGQRDGKLIFYAPTGKIAREIDFRGGVIDGSDRTYNTQGEVTGEQKYVDGRRIVTKGDTYISTKKKSEGQFLYPRMTIASGDNFWNATLATFGAEEGEPVRHGAYNSWHVNGQLRTTGEYAYGQPVGEFSWWHANGQIAIRGKFVEGQHDDLWQWWHANGMRSARGRYKYGARVGRWIQWDDNGKLADTKNHGGSEEVVEVIEEDEDVTSRRPQRLPENDAADATPTNEVTR